MKKSYITPEFELIDISTAEFLAGSPTLETPGASTDDDWADVGGDDYDEW